MNNQYIILMATAISTRIDWGDTFEEAIMQYPNLTESDVESIKERLVNQGKIGE